MSQSEPGEVTALLAAWGEGDRSALAALMPLVYAELRVLADRQLRGERPDHTLQPTALVHEAYLRLADQARARWRDRMHFLAVAAGIMRRILVDHARKHRSAKRGGGLVRYPLEEGRALAAGVAPDLLALDEALVDLAAIHPQLSELVELRYFGGLSNDEVAAMLEVSVPTVTRRMRVARAWLFRALGGRGPGTAVDGAPVGT